MPRALVIDLWGSATLRTGGEEIAQGLALMGCRPTWDHATGRVLGVEVLPCAATGRPRVDVTWRISGLFRDLFPAQIALLDAAAKAVAARDEADDENPLARRARTAATTLARIFGTAPGAYGAGIEGLIGMIPIDDIGAAYLAAASHAYGGADGEGDARARRVRRAGRRRRPAHPRQRRSGPRSAGRRRGRRLRRRLRRRRRHARQNPRSRHARHDRSAPPARAAAVERARPDRARARHQSALHRRPDAPRPARRGGTWPRRWIAWSISPRRPARCRACCSISCTTLISPIRRVRDFLMRENPAAARAIAARLDEARRQGLWHPRRNDIDAQPRCGARGGGGMNAPAHLAAPRRLPGAVRADGDRRRAAWPGSRRPDRPLRSTPSPACARPRERTATASSRSPRAAASRSAA